MSTDLPAPGVILGPRIGPFEGQLSPDLLANFAAATGDHGWDEFAGSSVPPLCVVTLIWEAQSAGRLQLVPAWLQNAATGGVHGEHDVVVHRPLVPDEPLSTWVEAFGAHAAGRNAATTLHYLTYDRGGELVAEQWWTTIWLGVTCQSAGSPAPGHAFPDSARSHPVGRWREHVDPDMARRYAVASGDWSAHHFEVDAARRSGSDRIFLHGLCAMALCARGSAEILGCPPSRLRRVAVRFASPMPLGEQLDLRLFDSGNGGYAFEATCAGVAVVTNGRAELM
jgi:acyl dehydratase